MALTIHHRNQGKTITEQLEFGIRYFDIDLSICKGKLVTYHGFCDPLGGTDAAIGPSIERMFNEFDEFLNLEENRNEAIVLTFSNQSGDVQGLLNEELKRWTEENKGDGKLTIFDGVKVPGDTWPTLRELVDTNQRIVVFVRNPSEDLKNIGVLSERDHIFDTWINRACTFSCNGVVTDTEDKCKEAAENYSEKLVLITVNCTNREAFPDIPYTARLCAGHLWDSLDICNQALGQQGIPNFIMADWTQNFTHVPNIVQVVKRFNQNILKDQGNAVDISEKTASYIGFESNRNGKMISAGIEFNTQWLTDNELWEYKEWQSGNDAGKVLEELEYGKSICLQSKSNNKYLRAYWNSSVDNGLRQQDHCRGQEQWRIERYDPDNPKPLGTEGLVQAGDEICLYSVVHDRYVRANDNSLELQVHCGTDEKFYVHAGWNDSDEDRVIDEGDNCPVTYNPEQKDTDGDGVGDACDPVTDATGGGGGCLIGTVPGDL